MSDLDKNNTYTLDEFLLYVKEDRAELYEGIPVFMSPASFQHENVILNLSREIGNALKGSGCLAFGSNLQVIFPFQNENKGKKDVVVMPDISIVCDRKKLRNKRCYGAPDLVVEVLSPSSSRNDRLLKRSYYEMAGVKEYLIVDHENLSIEKYVLHEGTLKTEEIFSSENPTFVSTLFPHITFPYMDIFPFADQENF